MSLESQIGSLVEASNNLTGEVVGKMNELDQKAQSVADAANSQLQSFKSEAEQRYLIGRPGKGMNEHPTAGDLASGIQYGDAIKYHGYRVPLTGRSETSQDVFLLLERYRGSSRSNWTAGTFYSFPQTSGAGSPFNLRVVSGATHHTDGSGAHRIGIEFAVPRASNLALVRPVLVTYKGEDYVAVYLQPSGGSRFGPRTNLYFSGHHRGANENGLRLIADYEIDEDTEVREIGDDDVLLYPLQFGGRPGDSVGTGRLMPGISDFEQVRMNGLDVVRRGSNSNGNWSRDAAGTQTITRMITLVNGTDVDLDNNNRNIALGDVAFPAEFMPDTNPSFSVALAVLDKQDWRMHRYRGVSRSEQINNLEVDLERKNGSDQELEAGDVIEIYITATGAWERPGIDT